MTRTYIIGARGSKLSLAQVQIVLDALRAAHPDAKFEVREIKTEGDANAAPLSQIGGLGVFTKAIEDALLAGTIDIAVHSLKDLPPQLPDGLTIAAVPPRADVRDALVATGGRKLAGLSPGARIGTGSARRAVQLKQMRADVEPVEIRGNVPTRIAKVESGQFDAAVLALAGLQRLGLESKVSQIFSVDEITPAVGQGALGVEVRADDAEAIALVAAIDDFETHICVTAERAFLDRLGAGCRMPVGGYAVMAPPNVLTLSAMIGETRIDRRAISGATDDAVTLGTQLADEMMAAANA